MSFFQNLNTFIKTPFTNYKKATELLSKHANNKYHLFSAEKGLLFIENYKTGNSIEVVLNDKLKSIYEDNKK